MEIGPILYTLRQNKLGATLIALQIAITVAIVSNSLSIVQQRVARMARPSGLDEANTFTLSNRQVADPAQFSARVRADLEALRATPGVVEVSATNSFPLRGYGSGFDLKLSPDQERPTTSAASYAVDERAQKAWGLKLISGRWFSADEVQEFRPGVGERPPLGAIVITQSLAQRLFGTTPALGRTVYIGSSPARIAGIVERAQAPWAAGSADESERPPEHAVFMPWQYVSANMAYLIRTQPGKLEYVMRDVRDRLIEVSRARVIDELQAASQTRKDRYRTDRALGLTLIVVSVLLVVAAACGIVGLTTYWVAQRRRHIGVRRALGARRSHILQYFHTENFLIAGMGAVAGIVLAIAGNVWLARYIPLAPLGTGLVLGGAAAVLVLSQLAVAGPALRAASVAPATAVRGT